MQNLKMTAKHVVGQVAGRVRTRGGSADLSKDPIRLYWWTDRVNMGDVLSADIVRYISGRPVEWASLADCNLISTGSIYGWLRIRIDRYGRDVHVWGSGIKKPWETYGTTRGIHHHLVRGPLTIMATGIDGLATGDPGLLAGDAYDIVQASDASGIGIIPHRSQWSREDYIADLKALPNVRLIDFRTDDCRACVEEMAACEMIISSSLHGLIVADALGIPNYWMEAADFEGLGREFKYFDYGLSVGRLLRQPVSAKQAIAQYRAEGRQAFGYLDNIPAKKLEIAQSFPWDIFGGQMPARYKQLTAAA